MSTRRERAERKRQAESRSVSPCSYGVHTFVHKPLPDGVAASLGSGPRYHECTSCGASYIDFDHVHLRLPVPTTTSGADDE